LDDPYQYESLAQRSVTRSRAKALLLEKALFEALVGHIVNANYHRRKIGFHYLQIQGLLRNGIAQCRDPYKNKLEIRIAADEIRLETPIRSEYYLLDPASDLQ
jgi:hypothetical protein